MYKLTITQYQCTDWRSSYDTWCWCTCWAWAQWTGGAIKAFRGPTENENETCVQVRNLYLICSLDTGSYPSAGDHSAWHHISIHPFLTCTKKTTFKLESMNNKNKWMGLQNDQSTAVFFKCLKWLARCQGAMCACQPMRKGWIPYYRYYLGARFMCPGRTPASDRKLPSVLKVCMKLSRWLCSPAGAHWALTPAVSRSTSPLLPQLWLSYSVTDDLDERLGF